MNRLFITIYTAAFIAIIFAVTATTIILWIQWQPEHNYQLRRFTGSTLKIIRQELQATQNEEQHQVEFRDVHGKKLVYTSGEISKLRQLTREVWGLLALVYIEDLAFNLDEHQKLERDEVIFRDNEESRLSYMRFDEERVLEVELPNPKGNGNQWMAELIFLFDHQGGCLQDKLSRADSVLFDTEETKVQELSASKLSRADISRLLITPRTSMSFISTNHQVRFLHIPDSREGKEPQLVEMTIFLSATLLPPTIVIPLIMLFVGFALWIKLNPIARKACQLAQVTQQFGEGDLTARVKLNGFGPVEKIAACFDQAADRVVYLIHAQEGLLHAVSHELRTPISRLYFLTEMLQDEADPDIKNQFFKDVEANLDELKSLTTELLNYKKYRQQEINLRRDPCHASRLIQEILRQSLELPSAIEFKDYTSGEVSWFGEEEVLTRALNNLIKNAARHARTKVCVSLHHTTGAVEELGEGEWLELWIEDDGEGIPKEFHERIFEPFVRVDESRNRELGGVGLGLSIAKTVINALDGEIMVDDSRLGGACFKVILPAQSVALSA
jgi:signal transduction histidine kinase